MVKRVVALVLCASMMLTLNGFSMLEEDEIIPEESQIQEQEDINESVEDTVIEEVQEEQIEPFNQTKTIGDIEIYVAAPAGVFPESATLEINAISNKSTINDIEDSVSEKVSDDVEIEESYSFDIKVLGEDGAEVEPDTAFGEVEVTFKNVGALEASLDDNKELSIYHVSDDLSNATKLESIIDATDDTASINTTHFSIYTVVITSGVKKDAILHYYQAPTKASSYFTIYNEKEFKEYRDLVNGYYDGSVSISDSVATILVNSDDSNPIDGITGNGQSANLKVSDLCFSVKIMDDLVIRDSWTPIKNMPERTTFDGGGHKIEFKSLKQTIFSSGNHGILIDVNDGMVKNVLLNGNYTFFLSGSVNVGGIVGNNRGTIINSIFNNGSISPMSYGNVNIGAVAGALSAGSTITNIYTPTGIAPYGKDNGATIYNILSADSQFPTGDDLNTLNGWVNNSGTAATGTLYWGTDGKFTEFMPQESESSDSSSNPPVEEEGDEGDSEDEVEGYATVTVRVDGKKAEIGEAITGAEALAASYDGEHYITLARNDDLSVYRTERSNLEKDKTYSVFYVYENENETISAASITRDNPNANLNYVSVTYDLEGANTYKEGEDGQLSENVMAAVRVDIKPDGSFEAQEDYQAVLMAAPGYEIPAIGEKVAVQVGDKTLTPNTEYRYVYDSSTGRGKITVYKQYIKGPMRVGVVAGAIEDTTPVHKIKLYTTGGTISDPLWTKVKDGEYERETFEDVTLPSASAISPINGSNSIEFGGWQKDRTGSMQTNYTYEGSQIETKYYANWVIANTKYTNGKVSYLYNGGTMDVRGETYDGSRDSMTVFSNAGFKHSYNLGPLSSDQINGNAIGTPISMASAKGADAFVNIPGTSIYVALVYTIENNFVDITYVFENRGTSAYNQDIFWGNWADVQIAGDDSAVIRIVPSGSANPDYITMTSDHAHGDKEFRLYAKGANLGVDTLYSFWYGGWSGASTKPFTRNYDQGFTGDSGLAYSWRIPANSIPAGGYVKRSTKMGMGNASSMNQITGTLKSGEGAFSDGSSTKTLVSNNKQVVVSADNKVSAGGTTVNPPTRSGWKFDHWSIGEAGGPSVSGRTFDENVILVANWVPKPDKSVTNSSSIQKVKGSDNLIVPKSLGRITIKNTTPGSYESGSDVRQIVDQGDTVQEAAGYASGFSGILGIEGADDRYLLPDDVTITVRVVDSRTGQYIRTDKLTKGTGYEYNVWNNRKNATLTIRNQFINGDLTIKAIGYELPPAAATDIKTSVSSDSISVGETAVFSVSAETSKNHTASYQWYIAPYYDIELDRKLYWTYQNQNGEMITNGTFVPKSLRWESSKKSSGGAPVYIRGWENADGSPISLKISGANKPTLRIEGLPVNEFGTGTNDTGLHKGGYHVYCVVTSTRNITGQQIIATSDVAEIAISIGKYNMPKGLVGAAPTYADGNDGSVIVSAQVEPRTTLQYRKKLGENSWSVWEAVTDSDILAGKAGEIKGLKEGIYQFRYGEDADHNASDAREVIIPSGRYIKVTYIAEGCDNPGLREQVKHVKYGTDVTAATSGLEDGDDTIVNPIKTGNVFVRWDPATITSIKEDTTVRAVYNHNVITLTLNNSGADKPGSTTIYENYGEGFYSSYNGTNVSGIISGAHPINLPQKEGYDFLGYYSSAEGGVRMINPDGCLSSNLSNTAFTENVVLYARWQRKDVKFISPKILSGSGEEIVINTEDKVDEGTGKSKVKITITNPDYTPEGTPGAGNNPVILIYSGGVLKDTKTATYDENGQFVFELSDEEIDELGGGTISFIPANNASDQSTFTYNVTYKNVDGTRTGADIPAGSTYASGLPNTGVKGVELDLPRLTRTGYTFVGWYTTPRGTGSEISSISASNYEDITVYAKWNANKYTLALNTNGGSFVGDYAPPLQYEHGGTPVMLPNDEQIAKEGYVFTGWYANDSLEGEVFTQVNTSLIGKVTYYASWREINRYTITLEEDGAEGKIYRIEPIEGYDTTVNNGASFKFRVTLVGSAYNITAVRANGRPLNPDKGVYTIDSVTDNVRVTVDAVMVADTDLNNHPDAVAHIDFDDGTSAYFDTIEEAIEYAAEYGKSDGSTNIILDKDLKNPSLIVPVQNMDSDDIKPFKIDLNGHSIVKASGAGEGDTGLNVKAGAGISIVDSSPEHTGKFEIPIENRGEVTIGEGVEVPSATNYGTIINNGALFSLNQGESEDGIEGSKSRFVNNGTVTKATLTDGYFVENSNPGSVPGGLSGHTTIMNGNEYYVNFQDAVDIANESGTDSTILILQNVDLNIGSEGGGSSTINVGNENGKKINIDLNGHSIYNGTINTDGTVGVINTETLIPGAEAPEITSTINNNGQLELGAKTKLSGNIINGNNDGTDSGKLINNGSTISGSVTNNLGSDITNKGVINGVLDNKGEVENEGTLQNVIQNGGKLNNDAKGILNTITQNGGVLNNNGKINSDVNLNGGGYMAGVGATPQRPSSGAVMITNTTPPTFYATLKDAIEDINKGGPEGSDGEDIRIELLEDVGDIGSEKISYDPEKSDRKLTIDLNGHNINSTTPGGGLGLDGGQLAFENSDSEKGGSINLPIIVNNGGGLNIGENTTSSGALEVKKGGSVENIGTITGSVNNGGSFDNSGEVTGTLTNTGDVKNENEGSINTLIQSGGTTTNNGNGNIDNITQTGGVTTNNGEGIIGGTSSNITGGGVNGNVNGQEDTDTVATIGELKFNSLSAALSHAANMPGPGPVEVVLNKDLNDASQKATLAPNDSGSTPVKLVMGEHSINSPATLEIGKGAKLIVSDDTKIAGGIKGGMAQITDSATGEATLYADIETAIDVANSSKEDVVVKLIGNAIIPSGENGGITINNPEAKVTLDLDGNSVTGGAIKVGSNSSLDIKNNKQDGAVQSAIVVESGSSLNIGTGTKINGDLTNKGNVDNKGEINGKVDHQGGELSGNDPTNSDIGNAKVALITTNESGQKVTKYYQDIQSALDDSKSGDTVKLLSNIEASATSQTINITTVGVTLDLAGNTIPSGVNINVADTATGIVIKDSGTTPGNIAGTITNSGELTIESSTIVASTITNNGTLKNKGTINKVIQQDGIFTNEEGASTSLLTQTGGRTINNDSTGIVSATLSGGGYEGSEPSDGNGVTGVNIKIGDKLYADLETAIEDANNSTEDVEIVLTGNVTLGSSVDVKNKNGKNITIDLGGHTIAGGESSAGGSNAAKINVSAPGKLALKDSVASSTNGANGGTLDVNINVNAGAVLNVEANTDVDGDITNSGTTDIKGTVLGVVDNKPSGNLKNNGVILGNIDNSGTLVNNGNIESDVVNRGEGSFTNTKDGNVVGQLENKDNATTNNKGSILQVNIAGGNIRNEEGATIDTVLQVGGQLDNEGEIEDVDGVSATLTYVDKEGRSWTEYYSDMDELLIAAHALDVPQMSVVLRNDISQTNELNIVHPGCVITFDLNGHTMGDGSGTLALESGELIIVDSSESKSGGILSPIKQTGGSLDLEGGTYYGVTLAPTNPAEMKTNLTGGQFSAPPSSGKPAISVEAGSQSTQVLLTALGQDTIKKTDGSPSSISVDESGNISLGTSGSETIKTTTLDTSTNGIQSDLELVQTLNKKNPGSATLSAPTGAGSTSSTKLNSNVSLDETLNINGKVDIDLSGKTITGPAGKSGSSGDSANGKPAINVESGSNIIISDTSGSGGAIVGGRGASSNTGVAGNGGNAIKAETGSSITADSGAQIAGGKGGSSISGTAGVGGEAIEKPESGVTVNGDATNINTGSDGKALPNDFELYITDGSSGNNTAPVIKDKQLSSSISGNASQYRISVDVDTKLIESRNDSIINPIDVIMDVPELLSDITLENDTRSVDVTVTITQKDYENGEKISEDGAGALLATMEKIAEESEDPKVAIVLEIVIEEKVTTEGVADPEVNQIKELGEKVKFTIKLPKNMQGGSDYQVIRHHENGSGDGVVEIIDCEVNASGDEIAFYSDRFSHFGIIYTPKPKSDTNKPIHPIIPTWPDDSDVEDPVEDDPVDNPTDDNPVDNPVVDTPEDNNGDNQQSNTANPSNPDDNSGSDSSTISGNTGGLSEPGRQQTSLDSRLTNGANEYALNAFDKQDAIDKPDTNRSELVKDSNASESNTVIAAGSSMSVIDGKKLMALGIIVIISSICYFILILRRRKENEEG